MSSSTVADADLPTFADVVAAADRLKGQAIVTPLVESSALNKRLGFRLLVKAEPLQRTGSFKFRGAFNRLVQLDEAARRRGVVAFSSGNHAQGVAAAAEILGMPATIVMPADAPAIKLANTRGYGAEVVTYDRWTEDREAVAARIAAERGATIVKPYDERDIIAGQGTAALEIIAQAAERGIAIDAMAANSSGGGLIAGCALAFAARSPVTKVYCAEPTGFDDHARSLAAGSRVANTPGATSICDALLAATPGRLTFEINRRHLAGGLVASDAEAKRAMAVAFNELKLVVEPGGAIALAAALEGRFPGQPRTVAVIASGGNVDPALFREALAA
ncbi:serine/threonine dehydratase [Aliidongia dinghuensis]|uniref:Serine/threonine dehydratase n=1 Tax=Aliidongia dinghuensis TaxID=1867774 RepID=A0A8J3E4I1_9PROT|nr:threonine/serine dehydratase [Aliidongia dinghuensis]GGF27322.1 serine/threonine dehydratase [Aliidongia dinghuensis]